MTAAEARVHRVLDRPACTLSAIRAVLAANADAAVLRSYDADLDAAYEQAREDGDLTPLVQTVRRWWVRGRRLAESEAQREILARVEHYQREAPPPATERTSWEEIRTQHGL